MPKVWILARCHNDHNQHGHYFVAAFKQSPTVEQLLDFIKDQVDIHRLTLPSNVADLLKILLHLQKGGGRIDEEEVWFCLTQTDLN